MATVNAVAAGPARLEVDLDRRGRHIGALHVPYSHDRSAYGRIVVPVIVVQGGAGPTLLLTGGVHGDEYEGQIALSWLARTLDPELVSGRVIIVPTANPAASRSGTRTSPIDRVNLARCFPGNPAGLPTEQIAEGISRLLLPLADHLIDLHSGGSTLDYLPCAFGRLPADRALAERSLDLMLAFDAPYALVMRQPEASATLVSAALARGVTAMATELGGAGGVTPATVGVAKRGLLAAMVHLGMLEGQGQSASRTRLMAIEPDGFVRSPGRGVFEPALSLGDAVQAQDGAGLLWDMERQDHVPEELRVDTAGMVVCRRVPAFAEVGDVLLHLARDAARSDFF